MLEVLEGQSNKAITVIIGALGCCKENLQISNCDLEITPLQKSILARISKGT